MANPIIRPIPLYIGNVKVAQATKGTYKINGNVSRSVASDEVGINRGVPLVDCNFTEIVPVKGRRLDAMKLCASQTDLSCEIFAEGRTIKADGVLDGASLEWDYERGSATGDSSFIGGSPEFN